MYNFWKLPWPILSTCLECFVSASLVEKTILQGAKRNSILISSSNLAHSFGEIESNPAEIEKIPLGGGGPLPITGKGKMVKK